MAAWQVRPPRLVTIAAAFFMIGSQSGVGLVGDQDFAVAELVQDLRRPGSTRTGPLADLLADAAARARSTGPLLACSVYDLERIPSACCDCTVSGRACTMNSSPVRPSLAHSMSIGVGRPRLAL